MSPIASSVREIVVPGQRLCGLTWMDGLLWFSDAGLEQILAIDPESGRTLWSHPHDTDGDMNNSTPIWGPDNLLIVSSGYNQGTRGLRLQRAGGVTTVSEAWFTSRLKLMFANAIRLGNTLYGTHGDFGPAFLTAVDVRTGAVDQLAAEIVPHPLERSPGRENADGRGEQMRDDGAPERKYFRSEQGLTVTDGQGVYRCVRCKDVCACAGCDGVRREPTPATEEGQRRRPGGPDPAGRD